VRHLGYEIRRFRPEDREQTLELLPGLPGPAHQDWDAYFRWKYEENPFAEAPMAAVALSGGRVVGFRAGLPTHWVRDRNAAPANVLVPADLCIHASHRRKGLASALARWSMEAWGETHAVLMLLSLTPASLPVAKSQGYRPLEDRVYLSRYTLPGLARFLVAEARRMPRPLGRVAFGAHSAGKIVVSDRPWPRRMAAAAERDCLGAGRHRLSRESHYFAWRFRNPEARYVFYFQLDVDDLAAYVVVRVSPHGRRGVILDLAAAGSDALADLLRFVVGARYFDVLSIHRFSAVGELRPTLSRLGFTDRGPLRRLERLRGEVPVAVRPAKWNLAEADWNIGGWEISDPATWWITGVCSDEG